ncbi:MAG: hypothetical protein EAZ47_01955 [Bacteroidetes bacterium]|nr:MAG: hypothetical protein EAY72_09540 [Bacteroidota bacterium]TAF97158.1 MAG: hypothetical protein EAZ47_01955 [Bacteroidota bacterium]
MQNRFMKQFAKKLSSCILVLAIAAASCKKTGSPNVEADHAAITTLTLSFSQNGAVVSSATFDDPDGFGGNAPVRFDSVRLAANSNYTMTVTLQNKTSGTVTDMTDEIRRAGNQHEFYFLPTSGLTFNATKLDRDVNGFPLGFNNSVSTGAASNGSILVKLMHKPLLKGPNDAPTVGHSDIEVNFRTFIQ